MTSRFDPELTPGARNAIRVCLNVQPDERVTVIADRDCEEIAASLVEEIEAVGAPYRAFVLEEEAPRPLVDFPPPSPPRWSGARCRSLPCRCSPTSCSRGCR